MERRFRHVTAATTVALLIAGPGTVSAATTASAPVDGPTTARIGLAGADPDGTSGEINRAFGHLPQRRMNPGVDYAARAAAAVPAALAGTVSSVAKLEPEKRGRPQFAYRVAAGPRHRVLSGGGVDPGGPVRPAEPATAGTQVEQGGPVQQSAGAMPPSTQVNPGGLMQPGGPEMPADPVRVLAPQVNPGGPMQLAGPAMPAAVAPSSLMNPGGPMQPAGPLRPVILGGPARRALPTDGVAPTPPTVTSTA